MFEDREFQAWEITRDAMPRGCRRCLLATAVMLEIYAQARDGELPLANIGHVVKERIGSKCESIGSFTVDSAVEVVT